MVVGCSYKVKCQIYSNYFRTIYGSYVCNSFPFFIIFLYGSASNCMYIQTEQKTKIKVVWGVIFMLSISDWYMIGLVLNFGYLVKLKIILV